MKYISHLINGKIVECSQVGITWRAAMMREAVSSRKLIAVLSVYPVRQGISKKNRFMKPQTQPVEEL